MQSNLNLEADSQPAPKLRRTKTFANFARRPSPMTSLRGKSIETLARLGGHSFLVLPAELAPFPLQLPACIVATVMYLRKGGTWILPSSTSWQGQLTQVPLSSFQWL